MVRKRTTNDDEDLREEAAAPDRPPTIAAGGGWDATIMLLCGFAASVIGMVLCAGPSLSWKAGQVSQGLGQLGLHGGTMIMGGLALAGMGLLRRGQGQLGLSVIRGSDDDLLLEQVAADLCEVRSVLLDVTGQVTSIGEGLLGLQAEVQAGSRARSVEEQGEGNAVFRLAASLDQLGARFEQRLGGHHAALQDGLAGLRSALDDCNAAIADLAAGSAAPAIEEEAPTPVVEPTADAVSDESEEPSMIHLPELPVEADLGHELAVDELSLGVLDALEDVPAIDPAAAALLSAAAHPLVEMDEALPGLEEAMPALPSASEVSQPTAVEDPAAALSSMLSDEEIRAALADLRDQAGLGDVGRD